MRIPMGRPMGRPIGISMGASVFYFPHGVSVFPRWPLVLFVPQWWFFLSLMVPFLSLLGVCFCFPSCVPGMYAFPPPASVCFLPCRFFAHEHNGDSTSQT